MHVQFSLIPLPISIPVGVSSKEYSFGLGIGSGLDFDSGLWLETAKSDWKSCLKFLFGMPVVDTIHVMVPKN